MITHLKKNKPINIDISSKKNSYRTAIAQGLVKFSKKTFKKIESLKTKKGEINKIAVIAGIMGAKKTSDLIPLCHNILIENIEMDIKIIKKDSSIKILSFIKTNGKTGVEMEALAAVSIAALTIYDMCKAVDKGMEMSTKLLSKKGGRSGDIYLG